MGLDQRLLFLRVLKIKGLYGTSKMKRFSITQDLRVFTIDNGIPVLLIDESKQVSDDEHQRLASKNGKI